MIRKAMVALFCSMLVLAVVPPQPAEAGFRSGLNRTFNKTKRFVKRHKKAIIVGAGIIVGVKVLDNNLLGAAVGGLVGYTIAQNLTPSDNKRVVRSTQSTLMTGESSEWENDKTGVSGRTAMTDESVEVRTIKAKYRKDRIMDLPPLEYGVGGQYRVVKDTDLRGGPGTDYKSYQLLKKDETIDVVAKVEDKPWYLASLDGVATGFVHAMALEATGIPVNTLAKKKKKSLRNVGETEISAKQVCRTIEQQVTYKNGKTVKESRKACQNPDGSWS